MATTVGAARQPFALLNGPRLQHLLNTRNGQNAISTFSSTKRKAPSFDSENIDPIQFPPHKKFKSPNGYTDHFSVAIKYPVTSPRRLTLRTCSQAPRLHTTTTPKSISLITLAGRSPSRKRIGILNRGKTASLFTHVGPRQFRANAGLGFNINAALPGTISSYDNCHASYQELKLPVSKNSWLFHIHEDTREELDSNMMEHSICTLDISSEEERIKDERGKENVPPHDDISQTHTTISGGIAVAGSLTADIKHHTHTCIRRRREVKGEACDINRTPLSEIKAEDFPR